VIETRWRLLLVFLAALAALQAACGGLGSNDAGQNDGLLIEFFDLAGGGLSVVQGDQGAAIVVEEGVAIEPLLVVGREDIQSWAPPEEYPLEMTELVEGEVTSGLASLAQADVELVFRLTIGDNYFWGFILYSPTGGYSPTDVGGYPLILFPLGFAGDFSEFQLASGDVTVDGVSLAEAARQAWSNWGGRALRPRITGSQEQGAVRAGCLSHTRLGSPLVIGG